MTIARRDIVPQGAPGVYHCMSRCVRRAFLCGRDQYSGRSYEHRRAWVRDRLRHLARFFGLEICAYAVMSNHTHVVLRTRPQLVDSWSDEETAWRWLSVFSKARDEHGRPFKPTEARVRALAGNPERLQEIRQRLGSISWFMRCLNEYIARRANREDQCKGRFWEGRFKCQALLDESAILACMAYVDLNPVRAGLADRPETSEFTSVHDRIAARRERLMGAVSSAAGSPADQPPADAWLSPLMDDRSPERSPTFLPLTEAEYLSLIDLTGRLVVEGKSAIPDQMSPLLIRLQVEPERWVSTVRGFGGLFQRVAGRYESIQAAARGAGLRWLKGLRVGRTVFA